MPGTTPRAVTTLVTKEPTVCLVIFWPSMTATFLTTGYQTILVSALLSTFLTACVASHAGGLVDEGGAGDVEHGAEVVEDAELGLAIERVVLAGEGGIGERLRMTSRCL